MKRNLFIIALAGVMMLAACKKQKENQGEALFTATTELQGGRTSLDPNNGNITWTAGDQIVIANDDDETAVFTLRSGEGTTEGGFGTSVEFNTVGPFIAAYPSTAMIAGDKVTFNLPATQAIENTETFANGANPMVAFSEDKNLPFKNLCGGLGIRLKGVGAHVTAVRITSKNTAEKLWGAYEVSNCAAAEPTLTVASGNQGSNVITLTCDVTLTTAAKTFLVMLPPGTLANGFTMEVLDGDEVLATHEATGNVAFVQRNLMKYYNEILIDVEFDGKVEIPEGLDNTNIIVTNLKEDAIPDENGDFLIGYSKVLTAKNAENGQIIYISNLSADYDINKGNLQQNYELSAKETALHYALCLIPYGLFQSKDATFISMKDALYELPCVKNLETAIQNAVNQYGYLKTDEIGTEIAALWEYLRSDLLDQFFENDKSTFGQNPIIVNKIELKRDGTVVSSIPHLPVSRYGGVRLDINENGTYFNESTNTWTVSMTGYNDNGVFLGVTKGTMNYNGQATPSPERVRYFLPPMNVGKFMGTFTSYSGIRAYFQDTWRLISEPDFGFDDMTWDKAKLDGITLELGPDDNAIVLRAPIDNRETAVMNVVYAGLQVAGIALDDILKTEGIEAFFTSLLNDADFVSRVYENFGGGLSNFVTITLEVLERFADFLLVEWVYTLDGMNLDKALDHISSPVARAVVELAGNNLGMIASWYLVNSFAFEVEKESSVVTTQSCEVLSTTQAVVVANLNKPNHVVEFGVCYSTSSVPTINDICVPLPSPYMAGCYQFQLDGLQPNTTYYARAYAKLYLDMLEYGDVVSFDTYNQPTVTTHELHQSDIGSTSATVTGSIVFLDPNQLAEYEHGFVLGETPNGLTVTSENLIEIYNGSELLNYSCTFSNLWPNTTYYVRAYSYSPKGDVVYGDVVQFKTLSNGGGGQIPTDGLVAYYPFNGNANDESGNGNNGILSGNNVPVMTTDRKGMANSAYEFGGYHNRNWIRVPNSSSLIFNQELTISYWIRITEWAGMDGWGSYSTSNPIFATVCKAGDGNATYPGLYMITGKGENGMDISCNNSNGNSHNQDVWNFDMGANYPNYQLGDWINITLVVDNVDKALYVNGQLTAQDELMKQADFTKMNQQDLYIGIYGAIFPHYFPFYGKMDDIRIYNRALTQAEINALYNE